MRPFFLRSAVSAVAGLAPAIATAAWMIGCTTGSDPQIPDVYLPRDAAHEDSGADGGFPDPVVDPCVAPGSTVGGSCADDADCDDQCYCNGVERCEGGTCELGVDPCLDEVDCTLEACLEETNTCFHMPDHSFCSNHMACDGYEQCNAIRGCVPASPLYCNDESACTVDSCDDEVGCLFVARDLDGDGYTAGNCGGEDCDDLPPLGTNIFPGAAEVCDNRRDDDCDGRRDYVDDSCVPTNDACASATVLPARSGTFSGSTKTLDADYVLGCDSGTGRDVVFSLTLEEPRDVRISVGGIADASLALRDFAQCETGPDLKCSNPSRGSPSLFRRSLPAGQYAIIVKTPREGAFDLSLTLGEPTTPPPVDVCDAETQAITAPGTYTGRFEETENDYLLSCHSSGAAPNWRDAAYRLVLEADSDVTLSGRTTSSSSSALFLSLVTDCSDPGTTLICQDPGDGSVRKRGVPAGTYYVLLEAGDVDASEWSLEVDISTPPEPRAVGDACATAVEIPLVDAGGGVFGGTGSVSLATAELDSGTSCGGSSRGNRDVYMYFDLPETRDVSIVTQSGRHFAALQTSCGSIGSELRCRTGPSPIGQTLRSVPAGRYFVAIATGVSSGEARATIETRPPTAVPPNDRCEGAIVLSDGDSRRDTLAGFGDDTTGCVDLEQPDSFYTFTLTERRRVLINVSNAASVTGARMYLTLRASCDGSSVLCANGDPAASIVSVLDPGTYTLVVEQVDEAVGDFFVDFATRPLL